MSSLYDRKQNEMFVICTKAATKPIATFT